jgi:predicted ATPase
MLKRFHICLTIALLAFLSAGSLHAQNIDKLDLQLGHERSEKTFLQAPPDNGEFKLSLGSQLFSAPDNSVEGNNSPEPMRIEIAESFSDIGVIDITSSARNTTPARLQLRSTEISEQQRFAPTITLSSAYADNAIGPNDPAAESLSIRGESGRLRLYGQLERQRLTTLSGQPLPGRTSQRPGIRSSVIARNNAGQQTLEPHEKSAALASRYYLEAVYSFKPTIKGKVSFRRSMIDTYESEEKLQVEGIVDANHNIQIKAGYKNEVRPEVTDTKSSNDTKVWTEFILKF